MNSKIDPRGAGRQLAASFLRPSGGGSHATPRNHSEPQLAWWMTTTPDLCIPIRHDTTVTNPDLYLDVCRCRGFRHHS